jgi:hypothetical protein
VFRRVGDELVLVNMTTNRMFAANGTAAAIWDALVDGDDVAEVGRRLAAETDAADAPADVDVFVRALMDEGLIERA